VTSEKPRTLIRINRKGRTMKKPWHDPKPTTNVASQERKDNREVRKTIRVDDHKAVRGHDRPED
jgi:hypothetical protein